MKILVIKFRNIGDVLLSTPLISNLRHHYSDATIDYAVNAGCEEMLSGNNDINNIIIYERPRIKKLNWVLRFREEINFTNRIRNERYDIVINLTEGDRGAQLAFFSGAKCKLGFTARKRVISRLNIFDKIADDSIVQHTIERDLQFNSLLGKEIITKAVKIHWSKDIDNEVSHILQENRIDQFALIHPVSRWMFKCWEDDRVARVIDYIQNHKECSVVITGSRDQRELERIERIIALCNTKPINLSGKLSLKHLASLASRARIFFGVDTAPMHIAAAVNTPVFALFGASYPAVWGPWDNLTNRLFSNKNGIQENGMHFIISNMNHNIFYQNKIKKSEGMVKIELPIVINLIDQFFDEV